MRSALASGFAALATGFTVPAQDLSSSTVALDGVQLHVASARRSLAPGTPLSGHGVVLSVQHTEGIARLSVADSGDGTERLGWFAEAFAEARLSASPVGRTVTASVAPHRLWLRLATRSEIACRLRVALAGEGTGDSVGLRLAVDHDADGQFDVRTDASAGGGSQLEVPLRFGSGGRDVLIELGATATVVARPDGARVARARAAVTLEILPALLSVDAGSGCGSGGAHPWMLAQRPRLASLYDLWIPGGAGHGEWVWLVVGSARVPTLLPGTACWLWTRPDAVVPWTPGPDGSLALAAGPVGASGSMVHVQAIGWEPASGAGNRLRISNALRLATL